MESRLNMCVNCSCNELKKIKIKKLHPNAKIPKQADSGSVGLDISVVFDDKISHKAIMEGVDNTTGEKYKYTVILPGERLLMGTGIACNIPEGYYMSVHVRSSVGAKKKIVLSLGTGIIDSSYTGEIMVPLWNTGDVNREIREGDRLVQGIILPYPKVVFEEVEELDQTERGSGGFGSTGN